MPTNVLEYGSTSPRAFTWRSVRRVFLLALPLIVTERACAFFAYDTIGELASCFYFRVVLCGNVVALACALASRRIATAVLLLLAMLIIPYQAFLGIRWWRVHREAQRIVDYVVTTHSATGQHPIDLRNYNFSDRGTLLLITYSADPLTPGGRSFSVLYSVGTRNTSHWWEPGVGWHYYPD